MNIYERLAVWLVFCVLMAVIFVTNGCTVITSDDPEWQYPVSYKEGLR